MLQVSEHDYKNVFLCLSVYVYTYVCVSVCVCVSMYVSVRYGCVC